MVCYFKEKTVSFSYHFSNSAEDSVYNLLSNGVVATGIVVGSIFLTTDELFWVEEPMVGPSPDLIYTRRSSHGEQHTVKASGR